jgi:Tfp pilus assembly protein PilF
MSRTPPLPANASTIEGSGDDGIGAHIVLTFDQCGRTRMSPSPLDRACEQYSAGRLDVAAQLCRDILANDPDNAEANHLLGMLFFRQGDNTSARDFMARAAASPQATAEMHNNLGSVFFAVGESNAATASFTRALTLNPDYAEAHNNLGVMHHVARRMDAAIEALRRAIQLKPDLAAAKSNLTAVRRKVVPAWHFGMMEDHKRNNAFEAAIHRVVADKYVLDIGSGSGLLSMMAARAGAAHVTSCEAVGVIAEQARDIVAKNGFASRVTVIRKRSQDLVVGKDLAQRADVSLRRPLVAASSRKVFCPRSNTPMRICSHLAQP